MRRALLVDTAGVAAATLIVFTGYLSASHSGGDPDPLALLTIGVVAAVVLARIVSSANRVLIPGLVVVVVAVVALSSSGDLFSSWALSGPFGYVNAKSAFFGLAVVGGLALGVLGRRASTRTLGRVAAVGAAAIVVTSGTVAVASLLPAAVLGVVIRTPRAIRFLVFGCALVVMVAIASTFIIAASRERDPGPAERFAARSLSERRLVLWHEAWVILRDHPVSGVGPGRFQVVSPTARSDRDSRWAHNEFLQIGAETGVPGLLGIMGVFAWGFARLSMAMTPTRATGLAALALAFLGIQACVDYVFHFPAIPVLGALLVGGLVEPTSGQLPEPTADGVPYVTHASEAAREARS